MTTSPEEEEPPAVGPSPAEGGQNAADRGAVREGEGAEPVPLSALQHAAFCLRQAALIHLEGLWEENRLTAEGRILHGAVDLPGQRRQAGVRRVTALPLASRRLGLAGVADLVEFHRRPEGGETPFPVEFKRGKPKSHRADEIQLCAQGLCLEEMTGQPVPAGALFYGESKRRKPVALDDELRQLTLSTLERLHQVFASGRTPPARWHSSLCRSCSLLDLCLPRLSGRPVRAWQQKMLASLLEEDGPEDEDESGS